MSLSRATQVTVSFPLIDTTLSPARKTGVSSFTSQISKDGGAFAATTNAPTEIATASGRYAIVLTAAEMAAAYVHLTVTATGVNPVDLMFQTLGLSDGIVTGSGSTNTSITASGQSQTATDHWKNAFLRFTSGSLAGQVRLITGYATGNFATNPFTAAPATGDRFVIVNG